MKIVKEAGSREAGIMIEKAVAEMVKAYAKNTPVSDTAMHQIGASIGSSVAKSVQATIMNLFRNSQDYIVAERDDDEDKIDQITDEAQKVADKIRSYAAHQTEIL